MANHIDGRLQVLFNVIGMRGEEKSVTIPPVQEETKPTDHPPSQVSKPYKLETLEQIEEVNISEPVKEPVNKFIKITEPPLHDTFNQPEQPVQTIQVEQIEQPQQNVPIEQPEQTLPDTFNQPVDQVIPTDSNKVTDKEYLVRSIISYGITIDGVKEKSGKLFDFSFDYREDQIDIEDLNMELIDDEECENTTRKPNFFNRFLKRK